MLDWCPIKKKKKKKVTCQSLWFNVYSYTYKLYCKSVKTSEGSRQSLSRSRDASTVMGATRGDLFFLWLRSHTFRDTDAQLLLKIPPLETPPFLSVTQLNFQLCSALLTWIMFACYRLSVFKVQKRHGVAQFCFSKRHYEFCIKVFRGEDVRSPLSKIFHTQI